MDSWWGNLSPWTTWRCKNEWIGNRTEPTAYGFVNKKSWREEYHHPKCYWRLCEGVSMQIPEILRREIDECKGHNDISDVGVLWCIIPIIDDTKF